MVLCCTVLLHPLCKAPQQLPGEAAPVQKLMFNHTKAALKPRYFMISILFLLSKAQADFSKTER